MAALCKRQRIVSVDKSIKGKESFVQLMGMSINMAIVENTVKDPKVKNRTIICPFLGISPKDMKPVC